MRLPCIYYTTYTYSITYVIILVNTSCICYTIYKEGDRVKISEYLNLGLTEKMLKQIEDYQFKNRIQSRSEAIRKLIDKGLKQEQE